MVSVEDVGGGWWQIVQRWTVEIEDACVADSVTRALV